MSRKKLSTEQLLKNNINDLVKSYDRWCEIYSNGSNDIFHCDGVNLNLVRNHILYYKNQISDLLKTNFNKYPKIYYRPEPQKVEYNLMCTEKYSKHIKEVPTFKTKNLKEMLSLDYKDVWIRWN